MCLSVLDVVEGDKLSFNCSVSYADYIGHLTPHYDWSALDDNEQQPVQITLTNSGVATVMATWPTVPQLLCFVYFNYTAESSYSDAASNNPSYSGNCTTYVINVLGRPRHVRINDTQSQVAGSHQLRCWAAGRPSPTYEWYRVSVDGDEQRLASGDSLILSDIGRHGVRCVALNVIRGVTYRTESDTVIVNVPPPSRQNDTDTIIDYTTDGRHRNDGPTSTNGSANATVVYKGNAMSRLLFDTPYFVPVTSMVAVVLLVAVSAVIVAFVRCHRRNRQQTCGNTDTAATPTLSSPNTQRHSGNDEPFERSVERTNDDDDDQLVGDEDSCSAVYDEITSSTHPPPASSQQYSGLIRSDVAPVVTHGTGVDVYSPLQRDANSTVTKITIAVGKCDVSIVFNGDGDPVTVPSIQRTLPHSPTS